MNAIEDIIIAPGKKSQATPRELLEDFADATPSWFFLEEDTVHYENEKGVPACVLQFIGLMPEEVTDLAFAAEEGEPATSLHLILFDSHFPGKPPEHPGAPKALFRFLEDFNRYVEKRHEHVELKIIEKK